jgi:glycosyltransferase involved in cell wall biosynthesis
MRIFYSLSYNPTLDTAPQSFGMDKIVTVRRSSDWGKTGTKKYLFYFKEALSLMRQAHKFDVLVICTVGMEAFVVGRLKKLLCPNTKVILADFLMPQESTAVRLVRSWLNGLDGFVCIRRGDIPVLERRFGIPAGKCHFAFFPVSLPAGNIGTDQGNYIYSAGSAHRDWPTLIVALAQLSYKAILSVDIPVQVPEDAKQRIQVLPMQSPEEGRKLMAAAKIVVLSLEDTELPSGPLVLLDAMAAGKAVVATKVNGTVDYVKDGVNGYLTAPKDSSALAATIASLMEDEALREKLGQTAREMAIKQFTQDAFFQAVFSACKQVCGTKPFIQVSSERGEE